MIAVWVGVLVLVVVLAYYGMWRGWRGRAARQSDLPEPAWLDGDIGVEVVSEGTYVSTTTGGHWMDRVAVHGLGALGPATIGRDDDGLLVLREHAQGFRIARQDLLGVRRQRGIAGKVRDRDGIVVITWRLGDHELDTGFRPVRADDAAQLENTVHRLMQGAHHA